MPSDLEIGRVVSIDTAQVTIELSADLKALSRATYESAAEVGRINSYVIIPVGARKIVAMVTRVFLTEEAEMRMDKTMVTLPAARRLMRATMIGTIDGRDFSQGIGLFPVLDTAVLLATRDDLEAIFGCQTTNGGAGACPMSEPGYCIEIGQSVPFPDFPVSINPDLFFGKHAAVIGSTGSGKSCTIATVIQSVFSRPEVRNTRFVILDTNGEYSSAFPPPEVDGVSQRRCLCIPTDPTQRSDWLVVPYWFMDSADFVRLFRAQPGVQLPVLLQALRTARAPNVAGGAVASGREILVQSLYQIVQHAQANARTSTELRQFCDGLKRELDSRQELKSAIPDQKRAALAGELTAISDSVTKQYGQGDFSRPVTPQIDADVARRLSPYLDELSVGAAGPKPPAISPDMPAYFGKDRFVRLDLRSAMERDEAGSARAREHCATMFMRIFRLLDDTRFEFLFGPPGQEWPSPLHGLATFLRDILGLSRGEATLSTEEQVPSGTMPFYDRQRSGAPAQDVVIIDLSLLASEVLENVTALIGRLILEFLQRAGDKEVSGIERGEFPVVLVLEEAQNYVPERRGADDESISRSVFERIAREGRKYGLGLVLASQRPSELSKTVLSQCSSFIVHRLQNPEDLRYFQDIVPGVYAELLRQLPALAPRYALVLGECVRAPALVRVRECSPVPRSKDPKFYERWTAESPPMPNVERVCERWEKGIDPGVADEVAEHV